MEPGERQNFIRWKPRCNETATARRYGSLARFVDYPGTTVFGGVTFQKTVPLSYWDVRVAQLVVGMVAVEVSKVF